MRKLLVGLTLLLLAVNPVPAGAQTAPSPNLLFNPSFEEGMYHQSMSNFLADGWGEWYEGRAADDPRGWWMPEPEYGLISGRPGQMHSGAKSQRWFNTWAIHNAGIYQVVDLAKAGVPSGSWLRFSMWFFSWSSQLDKFGISDGFSHKWVGIDPTGGVDPYSPNIVWGNEDRTMDVWVQVGVIAQAKADKVTVFVREMPEYSVKHNDTLIDDGELVTIPAPEGPVVQPSSVLTKKLSGDNTSPDKAFRLYANPQQASFDSEYAYFTFPFPGGDALYHINIESDQTEGFAFRVYGPTQGKVYATSGTQPGLVPDVTTDLSGAEAGTYLVQLIRTRPGTEHLDFRIWLSGSGLAPEAAIGGA